MQLRKPLLIISGLALAGAAFWLSDSDNQAALEKNAQVQSLKIIGNIATRVMPDDAAGGFHKIPVTVRELAPNIYQTTGIANAHMITTTAGNVMFDTGISIQAGAHYELMRTKTQAPIKAIILSHAHADHIGGTQVYKETDTEIITHREFVESQRYLKQLAPYQWNRNRTLFPWMPEQPATSGPTVYGGIEPSLLVTEADHSFELGGTQFNVLSTPGAEGDDNISLFLPEQGILFSGDFFGPLFPQFPNIFTMRGEKIRKPLEYIRSLDKLIALEPEMIVPSHHDPITGKENLRVAMTQMRDAVQYVHDETINGMNAGKSVYELMREIKLPEHLNLTQEHGKVSWSVKSIWEYYMTWFHFDSTTELYPVPARDVYSDVAELAGATALIARAQSKFDSSKPVEALHLLEMALTDSSVSAQKPALNLRLKVLGSMLEAAVVGGNNYEKDYLRRRIQVTLEALQAE